MPSAPVRIPARVDGSGQGLVGGAALGERGAVVDGGTNERMAERDLRAEDKQPVRFRGISGAVIDAQAARRPPEQPGVLEALGSREQQQTLGVSRQGPNLPQEALLEPAAQGQGFGEDILAGELARGQFAPNLDQRQGVAPGFGHDAITDVVSQRPGGDDGQKLPGVGVGQTAEAQLGQAVEDRAAAARLTHGEQKSDPVRIKPAGDEGEDLSRLLIQPLGVVDDAQNRMLFRRMREQGQRGEPDQKTVRRVAGDQSERRSEGVTLRLRKIPKVRKERNEQLVEGGEAELDLRLDPHLPNDPEVRGCGGHVLEQSGLADAGLAPDDERLAHAAPNGSQQGV